MPCAWNAQDFSFFTFSFKRSDPRLITSDTKAIVRLQQWGWCQYGNHFNCKTHWILCINTSEWNVTFTLKPIIYILISLTTFYFKNCSSEWQEACSKVWRNTIKATSFITGYITFGLQKEIGFTKKKLSLHRHIVSTSFREYTRHLGTLCNLEIKYLTNPASESLHRSDLPYTKLY